MNYIYELPFFRKQQDFAGKVLGGWQASGIVVYNSGLPFTHRYFEFRSRRAWAIIRQLIAGNRPNLLCDPNDNAPHTLQQWFNIACFQGIRRRLLESNVPGNSPTRRNPGTVNQAR